MADPQRPGDQPDILPLDPHACLIAAAFICPFHERLPAEGKARCHRFEKSMGTAKESIVGTGDYPHAVRVGARMRECIKSPPQFKIVDTAKKPRKRRTSRVDEP